MVTALSSGGLFRTWRPNTWPTISMTIHTQYTYESCRGAGGRLWSPYGPDTCLWHQWPYQIHSRFMSIVAEAVIGCLMEAVWARHVTSAITRLRDKLFNTRWLMVTPAVLVWWAMCSVCWFTTQSKSGGGDPGGLWKSNSLKIRVSVEHLLCRCYFSK